MSNVNMPSEQSRSSTTTTALPRDMRSVMTNNSMNTDGSIASTTVEVTTTVGKNKRAAEVQDATASCTNSKNSRYSQQQHCRHHHHHHHYHHHQQQQQQPSVKLSLRDISDILDPFFGTSTALPSSRQQEQQQRGQQQDDHHHENAAEAASNDHNDFASFSGVANRRQGLASSSDDDKSIGAAAEGSQAIQELIGAPSDSWIQSMWEMELEKIKMP